MSNPNMVPMLAPDGTAGYIPADRVNDALKQGGKLGVEMQAPDGTHGIIPRENVVQGIQQGGKVIHDSAQYVTKFEKDRNPENQPGIIHSVGSELLSLAKGATSMSAPGPEAVTQLAQGAGSIAADDVVRQAQQRSPVYRATAAVGSLAGVNAVKMEDAADVGNWRGVLGTAAGDALPLAAGEAVKRYGPAAIEAVKNANPPLKGVLADRMAEVPAGEQFSRQQVLDAARSNNVNLDVAQATDSNAARSIKRANQYSLSGEGSYESNAKTNMDALENWANKEASTYATESAGKEVVGGKLQEALKKHIGTLQNNATQIFNDLDRNVGNVKPDATSIYDKAKQIVAENADYYEKNPALKQSRAWQIVNDLANRAEDTKPTTSTVQSKIVDEGGTPYQKEVTRPPEVKPDTWTDLQKLRTDLMNEYRSPDIAGSRAEGWLKQLTGTIDQSMTGAGSGLTGPDLAKFRQANSIWEQLKNTYDNPQSPMYHALRAQAPSQVPGMLSKGTPELARQVRDTLGSLEGPFQRQFVENLLYAKDGQTLELGKLNQKLKGVSNEHLEAMIGSEGAKNLKLLAKVAQKVTADANPSGTAKGVVKTTEVVNALHNPVAGAVELGGNYAAAKAINSPRVLDYLTTPKK